MSHDLTMESERLRACLDADFRRLREVVAGADPGAAVPSCPGWILSDRYQLHVGEVYLHKTESMRLSSGPEAGAAGGLDQESPLDLLELLSAVGDRTVKLTQR